MRTCEHCGLSMGDTATFCPVCGARADAPLRMAAAATQSRAPLGAAAVAAPVAVQDERPAGGGEDARSRRRREAALPMREAGRYEKTDPARAATLYKEAIIGLLESAADPLDHEGVRRDLLFSFNRLSLVLKREGFPAEALEEIDCAASLGLLDCRDQGIKGHREALRKRRASLRRSLSGAATEP